MQPMRPTLINREIKLLGKASFEQKGGNLSQSTFTVIFSVSGTVLALLSQILMC